MIVQNQQHGPIVSVVSIPAYFHAKLNLNNRYLLFLEKLLCLPNDLISTAALTNKTAF
jgi:hypothetical protein